MECSSVASNQQIARHTTNVSFAAQRAPSSLKLITNRRTVGFEDAEALQGEQVLCSLSASATPCPLYSLSTLSGTQVLALSPDNLAQRLELKLVKFQNVERLCIFVAGNQDECETSAISGAWPVEGTRRVGGAGRGRGGGGAHRARVARADAQGRRAGSVAWRPPRRPSAGLTAACAFVLQA
jgi:hypothetical protein